MQARVRHSKPIFSKIRYTIKVLNALSTSRPTRINALDLIRGWCLIVIASDHLLRFPSLLDPFTGRGLLWVTAAEGFFFISGMLVGIARGRQTDREGLRAASRTLCTRAAKLYLASIILTLGYTFLAYWLQGNGVMNLKGGLTRFDSVASLLGATANLTYGYGWADFLSYYAVYLALAPAVLWLLRRRLWWVVVWISLSIWLLKSVIVFPFPSYFSIWQVYFFLGIVVGYHFGDIRAYQSLIPPRLKRALTVGVLAMTIIILAASTAFTFGTPFFADHGAQLVVPFRFLGLPSPAAWYDFFFAAKENAVFNDLFQNGRTGLLRLPVFLLSFTAFFLVVRQYETAIIRRAGWLLLPLGRNSLYVYIIESAVIFGAALISYPTNLITNTLANIAVILLLWLAVRQRFLFGIIPR